MDPFNILNGSINSQSFDIILYDILNGLICSKSLLFKKSVAIVLQRLNVYNYWPYVKMLKANLLQRLNVYNYWPYLKMFMTKLLHRLNIYNYWSYVKMLMTKL
jgi:hypothetical protein